MKHPFLTSSSLFIFCVFLLSACSQDSPKIAFLGIAKGNLQTDVRSLEFNDTFEVKDRELIAAVSLDKPMNGTTVVGTWFSPDERSIPLGSTNILLASGATLARFFFANKEDWESAPYMLDVRLQPPEGVTFRRTASGSLHFFIGMKKDGIQAYARDYLEWKAQEGQKTVRDNKKEERMRIQLSDAQKILRSSDIQSVLETDLTEDGMTETLFVDVGDLSEVSARIPSLQYSGMVRGFIVMSSSGTSLLSLVPQPKILALKINEKLIGTIPAVPIVLSVLHSHVISLSWNNEGTTCSRDFIPESGTWVMRETDVSPLCVLKK